MKQAFNPTIVFCIGLFSFQFTSCITMDPDPFIVPESRQKQNLYYVPSSVNQPLIRDKNDFNFSIQRSSSNKHLGAEFQGAFMPCKHLGLIASYTAGKGFNHDYLQYHRVEAGAGYIYQINRILHLETYAGFGDSRIQNYHYTGFSHIDIKSAFVQPAIVIINHNKSVRAALVSKFSTNNFTVQDQGFNGEREPYTKDQFAKMETNPTRIFWEPGIIFRFGWKEFLFHTGYSYNQDLSPDKLYRSKGNFSIGADVVLNFSHKKPQALH